MHIPTISQYSATVAEPAGLTRTLGAFEAERDNYGDVRVRTGNNAAVFRILSAGRDLMLKCYVRSRPDLRDVYEYISGSGDPLFPRCEFLPAELYVFDAFGEGEFYDVLASDWTDGPTLDTEIKRACREGDRKRLALLSENFDNLASTLLSRPWAHGDLKPENIVVSGDGSLRLIDFDALYYPGNPHDSLPEVGTPGYQHPARDENIYCKCVDDYPAALISVSLKALSLDPSLYGRFNRSDIIILNPTEVLSGTSEAYSAVKSVLADWACFGHYRLALMLRNRHVNLPECAEVLRRITCPAMPDGGLEPSMDDGLFGFRDSGGTIVMEPVFEEATGFREGAALVTIDARKRLIDPSGSYLMGDLEYDDIKPLSDGVAAFRRDEKWGYAAPDGEVVIEPAYDSAGNFHGGFAPVCLESVWGYIDIGGECVTGFVYERAFGPRGGVAEALQDGKTVKMDFNNISKGRN